MQKKKLHLSVIICTYNRAELLEKVLESLKSQTLSKNLFEIIVIDGSSDNTKDTVKSFQSALPVHYFFQNDAGLAAARNHGIYASQGEILLFLDDDDIATPTLLEEHIKTHRKYPGNNYAVLHYTTWAPNLLVTPLMHFITEVGCFLFSYPQFNHGDILDYTYFWGGRSSCKRSFLIEYGVFNPLFRFGYEDIELGYRLAPHGLKVVYNSKAVAKMIRPVSFDDFCRRLIKQGKSQYVFSTLHCDQGNHEVYIWAEIVGVEDKWNAIKDVYQAKIKSAKALDKVADMKLKYAMDMDETTKGLLHKAYWWAFKACKIKGIIEAKEELQQKAHGTEADRNASSPA